MNKPKIFVMLRTLLVTYILTGILLVILAFALYKFKLKESQVSIGVNVIYILTCLIGGFLAGKSIRQRRFVWGLMAGLAYFAVLFIVSLAANKGLGSDMNQILTVLGMCAGSGTIGGMLS